LPPEVTAALPLEEVGDPAARPFGAAGGVLGRACRRHSVKVALAFLVVLVVLALIAPLLGLDPEKQDLLHRNLGPGAGHVLGTDALGRDMFARVLYGPRISLLVAVAAAAASLLIGVPLGAIAGYRGGFADAFVSRSADALYAMPDLLFAILISALIRGNVDADAHGVWAAASKLDGWTGGLAGMLVALAVTSWLTTFRLVRGQVLALKEREFTKAAVASGARSGYVIRRHLLPNALAPIVVAITIVMPTAILLEAGLSFIGVGAQPPTASWGLMISEGVDSVRSFPHELVVPAGAVGLTLLAVTIVGDAIRDALDPNRRTDT
jgi:ABC-type dipeptide/oligopeptide/nickel transport system permease subunit